MQVEPRDCPLWRLILTISIMNDGNIMNEPCILEPEDPLKKNSDGNIHTAVVPADDNSLGK